MNRIDKFDGPHRFLSNFYEHPVFFGGKEYKTAEHAYQAQKTLDYDWQCRIAEAKTPAEAKQWGRKCPPRKDWFDISLGVMTAVIRRKFEDPDLRDQLLATGDADLAEGNTWGDTFWGVDAETGLGDNHLGKILMKVRGELK